jgi:hypothetical protein
MLKDKDPNETGIQIAAHQDTPSCENIQAKT